MSTKTLLERAAELGPALLAHRDAHEAARGLSVDAVRAAGRAGMFRAGAPADVGGEAAPLVTLLRAWEELAQADSAVAWCAYNSAVIAYASGFLAPAVRRELYADPDACFGFSGVEGGGGETTDDGFVVTGRWPVVSGADVSRWFLLAVRLDDEPAMIAVPRQDVIVEDTWHVGGMRGSGSDAVRVAQVVVPPPRVWWLRAAPTLSGPWFRLPYRTAVSPGGAAVALGVAQGAIDALRVIAERRWSATTRSHLRDQPAVQDAIVESTATLAAARAGYHEAATRLWAAAEQGEPALELRAAYWASQVPVMKAAIAVAGRMYEAGGADAMLTANPLERALRDVHALNVAAQRWAPFVRAAGRVMLGLPPGAAI